MNTLQQGLISDHLSIHGGMVRLTIHVGGVTACMDLPPDSADVLAAALRRYAEAARLVRGDAP